MTGFRAVVFDIGGVLVDAPPMAFDRRWESALGLPAGALTTDVADVWEAGAIGAMSEAEVVRALRERTGLTADQVDAVLADMWVEYLGTANEALIAYARDLRPAYRTGILSNSFVGAREREQELFGFGDLFDDLVYSHEVGINKPDPRIYAIACDRLGVAPAQTVFVDDVAENIAAAEALEITGVLFVTQDRTIADLDRLLRRDG
jgi:epoxide hydrolase-like predicted phosphatase